MHAIVTLEALSRVYVHFPWQLECVWSTVDAYTGNTANTNVQKQSKHTLNKASTANAQPPLQTSKYIIKQQKYPEYKLAPITLILAFRCS